MEECEDQETHILFYSSHFTDLLVFHCRRQDVCVLCVEGICMCIF